MIDHESLIFLCWIVFFNARQRAKTRFYLTEQLLFPQVNLGVGAYRTAEGKPWVLPVVKKAEAAILAATESGEY